MIVAVFGEVIAAPVCQATPSGKGRQRRNLTVVTEREADVDAELVP
jgi:hypothetical protein